MIESKDVDQEVMDKIKNSDQFETLIKTLESADNSKISVRNSYSYKSKDSDDYVIVMNIDNKSEDNISIVFKMSNQNEILDCSASFDEMISGDPDVSHILDFKDDSVHIKSLKDK